MDARHRIIHFLIGEALAFAAYGDTPLPPPQRVTVCSSQHTYCATADPTTKTTSVREELDANPIWEVSGYSPHIYLSNDGEILVVGYAGANLVPVDVSAHEPMLHFYLRGRLVRTVELGEWFPDPSLIHETVSHRSWGYIEALTDSNHLIVRLSDGRRISYNASSGNKDTP